MSSSPTDDDFELDREKFAPVEAWCDTINLYVRVKSGLVLQAPVWWYPRLANASLAQRNTLYLSPSGIHWEDIDEDISVKGLVLGWKDKDAVPPILDAAE